MRKKRKWTKKKRYWEDYEKEKEEKKKKKRKKKKAKTPGYILNITSSAGCSFSLFPSTLL